MLILSHCLCEGTRATRVLWRFLRQESIFPTFSNYFQRMLGFYWTHSEMWFFIQLCGRSSARSCYSHCCIRYLVSTSVSHSRDWHYTLYNNPAVSTWWPHFPLHRGYHRTDSFSGQGQRSDVIFTRLLSIDTCHPDGILTGAGTTRRYRSVPYTFCPGV